MNYIDTHCHLDFADYDSDREEVLARMRENKIGAMTVGASLERSKKGLKIAEANDDVWSCIGVHPDDAKEGFDEKEFEKLVGSPKVVGIGEFGLDYFRIKSEEEKINQKKLFEQQIQFAIKHDKPLMLHIREARPTESFGQAYSDAVDILKNYPDARGNVHFFAGDVEVAKNFLDLGFSMSFTGVITFTHDYDEVIKYIPRDSMLSETDAPFVAPVPWRGKRNEPIYVMEIVKKLAEIRGEDEELVKKALVENFGRVWGVSDTIYRY